MTTTEIKIPDDAWMDWPDECGWYFIGSPKEHEPTLERVTKIYEGALITNDDWIIQKSNQYGYRFARVILPVVPSKVNQ